MNFLRRDFLGFSNVKQTNPDSTKVERSFRQDGVFKGLLSLADDVGCDLSGQRLPHGQAINIYQRQRITECTSRQACTFPYLSETTNTLYDPINKPNAFLATTVSLTDSDYDAYGNVKKRTISGLEC